MGILDVFKRDKSSANETRNMQQDVAQSVADTLNAGDFMGESIIDTGVLQIPTVQACIDLIAGSFSQSPLKLYKKDKKGNTVEITNDYRLGLWNYECNEIMTSDELKKHMVRDYFLHGYTYIIPTYKPNSNKILNLYPIPSLFVNNKVKIIENNFRVVDAEIWFTIADWGIYMPNERPPLSQIMQSEMVAVLKNTRNGVDSIGLLRSAWKTFKTALNEMEYTQNMYENASLPVGYLSSDQKLSANVITRMAQSWKQAYGGPANSHKVVILEDGLTYKETSLKPTDLTMDSNRAQSVSDICKLFGVPESLIDVSSNKYGSIEQNNIQFLKYCLQPFLDAVESAINRTMLLEREKEKGLFFKFDTSAITQGTQKDLYDALKSGVEGRVLTINEARTKAGMPVFDRDFMRYGIGDTMYEYAEDRIIATNSKMGVQPQTGSIDIDELTKWNKQQNALNDAKIQLDIAKSYSQIERADAKDGTNNVTSTEDATKVAKEKVTQLKKDNKAKKATTKTTKTTTSRTKKSASNKVKEEDNTSQ